MQDELPDEALEEKSAGPQTPPWLRTAGEALAFSPEAVLPPAVADGELTEQQRAETPPPPPPLPAAAESTQESENASEEQRPSPPSLSRRGTVVGVGAFGEALEAEVLALRRQLAVTKVELARACGERDEAHAQLRAGILEKKRAVEEAQTPTGALGVFLSPFRGGKPKH